jgi:hypothetical protein
MPDILLPAIVAAAVSVLFGSASAALLSHVLSSFRAEKEYRLKKLEELFSAVQTWVHLRRIYHFRLCDIATAETTGNEGVELANSAGEQAQREYYKSLMISKIYFEDLTPPLDRIRECEEKGREIAARFVSEQVNGNKYPAYQQAFDDVCSNLIKFRDEFDEKLFEEAKRVTRGALLAWTREKFSDP